MTNSITEKKDIIIALQNAINSITESIRPIDELNGYLLELEEIDKEKLPEDAHEVLEEVHKLYMSLPVWDTLESHREALETILEEIEEDYTPEGSKMLEELTEESEE